MTKRTGLIFLYRLLYLRCFLCQFMHFFICKKIKKLLKMFFKIFFYIFFLCFHYHLFDIQSFYWLVGTQSRISWQLQKDFNREDLSATHRNYVAKSKHECRMENLLFLYPFPFVSSQTSLLVAQTRIQWPYVQVKIWIPKKCSFLLDPSFTNSFIKKGNHGYAGSPK